MCIFKSNEYWHTFILLSFCGLSFSLLLATGSCFWWTASTITGDGCLPVWLQDLIKILYPTLKKDPPMLQTLAPVFHLEFDIIVQIFHSWLATHTSAEVTHERSILCYYVEGLILCYYVGLPARALAGATIPRTAKTVISCCTASLVIRYNNIMCTIYMYVYVYTWLRGVHGVNRIWLIFIRFFGTAHPTPSRIQLVSFPSQSTLVGTRR